MKQISLQDVGLTDRYNRNRAQSNFKAIEDAVNSNASTAEGMYAELNGEARDRRAADQALEDKISQSEERLTKQIAALEDMLFGQHPQVVKMAENSTPPVNSGAMLVNLTNEEDK